MTLTTHNAQNNNTKARGDKLFFFSSLASSHTTTPSNNATNNSSSVATNVLQFSPSRVRPGHLSANNNEQNVFKTNIFFK